MKIAHFAIAQWLFGRPHPAFCDAPWRSRFALTVFGSMPKNENYTSSISRWFSRGNSWFVYHLVDLAKGHAIPYRNPDFHFWFFLATDYQIFGWLAL